MDNKPPVPPSKIPDPNCKHMQFLAHVGVHRIMASEHPNAPLKKFTADVHIVCQECGGAFMFTGLPVAISANRPCVNTSRTEACLPLAPYDGTLATGTIPVDMS